MTTHNFEVPLAALVELDRVGESAVAYELFGTQNGHGGPHLPVETMAPGDVAYWRVPVPPGACLVGWQTEFDNKVAWFSANGGPKLSYEPALYPVGYNPNTSPPPLTAARALQWATLRIEAIGVGDDSGKRAIELMTLRITWTLSDPAMYSAWVAAGRPGEPMESREDRGLRLLEDAGLLNPLMDLAGVDDLGALAARAVPNGTWLGLLRLIDLANERKSN